MLAIGTHALFEDEVLLPLLGLAIVDEQHRFGVAQRLKLRGKAMGEAHQLMMSATPIPRTLAMTFYADLDVSVLDEMPPGRTPVATRLVSQKRRAEVVERVRRACAEGRQAYWVCPLIEESEKLELQTAVALHAELTATLADGQKRGQSQAGGQPQSPKWGQVHFSQQECGQVHASSEKNGPDPISGSAAGPRPGSDPISDPKIGLLHGRMKPDDKAAVMADFVAGRIQVLVATTVIEVGVDVPNATVMAIEHAERFGLAQLHQLRGRVGRGAAESTCYLLFEEPLTETAKARLKVDLREQRRVRDRPPGPRHPRPGRVPGRPPVGRPAAALRRPGTGRGADRAGAGRGGRAAAARSGGGGGPPGAVAGRAGGVHQGVTVGGGAGPGPCVFSDLDQPPGLSRRVRWAKMHSHRPTPSLRAP